MQSMQSFMRHDICYRDNENGKTNWDRKMLAELNALTPRGRREKVDRQLVRGIIGLKHRQGMGVHWSSQLADELHKAARKRYQKRSVFAKQVDDIWTADLVDMLPYWRSNSGYKYLLTVIDVFGKYVALYSTQTEEKLSVVDRWNRTMKNITGMYFPANNAQNYIDVLPRMVEKYNNTYHRSIKLKPTDARKTANYKHIHNALHAKANARKATPRFHVGDKVCIVRKKGTFEKGFTPNWTEVYTITTVKSTKPPTYTIEDTSGEPVLGIFCEQELQTSVQKIYRTRAQARKRPRVCQLERLHQCIQFVDTTSRRRAAMNINKQYAWQSSNNSNSRENSPLLPRNVRGFVIGKSGSGKTTVIFNLLSQSLVRFWEESPPTDVQGAVERIRIRFEQTADFQCVR